MGLSEQEQQLLAQLERDFYASDSDELQPGARAFKFNHRAIIAGVVMFFLGIAVLLFAVMLQFILLGILGFGVLLGAVLIAFKPSESKEIGSDKGGSRPRAKQSSLRSRLEERWQDRQAGLR